MSTAARCPPRDAASAGSPPKRARACTPEPSTGHAEPVALFTKCLEDAGGDAALAARLFSAQLPVTAVDEDNGSRASQAARGAHRLGTLIALGRYVHCPISYRNNLVFPLRLPPLSSLDLNLSDIVSGFGEYSKEPPFRLLLGPVVV